MTKIILPDSIRKFNDKVKDPDYIQVDNCVVTAVDTITGAIVQNTYAILEDEVINHIQDIMQTKDDHVKNALISLGWTPPEELIEQGVKAVLEA